jgi:hypothetical protein
MAPPLPNSAHGDPLISAKPPASAQSRFPTPRRGGVGTPALTGYLLLGWQPRIGLDPIGTGRAEPSLRGGDGGRAGLTGLHVQPRLAVGDDRPRMVSRIGRLAATLPPCPALPCPCRDLALDDAIFGHPSALQPIASRLPSRARILPRTVGRTPDQRTRAAVRPPDGVDPLGKTRPPGAGDDPAGVRGRAEAAAPHRSERAHAYGGLIPAADFIGNRHRWCRDNVLPTGE